MSIRHGKVTRWEVFTTYRVEVLTIVGRKTDVVTVRGDKSDAQLKAEETTRRLAAKQVVTGFKVLQRERRLYGMTEDEYYSRAKVLQTVTYNREAPPVQGEGEQNE